ncbi:MFS transporter [Altererythrobacter xixiisoli]|uniref:MFS transporter n=1 Tax=Croceibacterium xixiisoli TaxID=1476466 RepID=A0A6I4TPB0_9SPHN|nr:MFS transporter [Croceibacterium xixiisoli]MXO97762.1 MFS transporter [Croceibacterium xixiisoli]
MSAFHLILVNNLIQNITNFTVWFALVFWAFLETQSVFVTGMIGGIYLLMTAGGAVWFGSLVDHHRKRAIMLVSSAVSFLFYAAALALVLLVPPAAFADVAGPSLWALVFVVMLGVTAGNLRMIALPTLVTAMIPADRRDKANGLVGMVSGIGFVVTSAISGFLVAWGGMQATLVMALLLTAVAFVHMLWLRVNEPAPGLDGDGQGRRVDLRGTIRVVAGVPGLFALIAFSCFNNLLGGVFMALMDGYGLSLMQVEQWGLLWAVVSCAFIVSGLVIARYGLGRRPLRVLLLANLIVWAVASVFTLQSSVWALGIACFIWLFLNPFAEAAEQTTLQQVVPFERQGRVFGFAQSIEQAASPLTAFIIGPLTQFLVIPWITGGGGTRLIGAWYGTGPERGMALVFSITGLIGVLVTLAAFRTRSYRMLSQTYAAQHDRQMTDPSPTK